MHSPAGPTQAQRFGSHLVPAGHGAIWVQPPATSGTHLQRCESQCKPTAHKTLSTHASRELASLPPVPASGAPAPGPLSSLEPGEAPPLGMQAHRVGSHCAPCAQEPASAQAASSEELLVPPASPTAPSGELSPSAAVSPLQPPTAEAQAETTSAAMGARNDRVKCGNRRTFMVTSTRLIPMCVSPDPRPLIIAAMETWT